MKNTKISKTECGVINKVITDIIERRKESVIFYYNRIKKFTENRN